MFEENIPQGAKRERNSGALIFPVHPREIEQEKKLRELDKELNKIRLLKEELQSLKDNLSK